ncbi:MAG: hypothetical protein ACJZ1O_05550 [Candidatus Neomarinimicrobiota bacterium]
MQSIYIICILSILTLSVGCGQKKDDKDFSSKEETQSVDKNQASKTSNNKTDQCGKASSINSSSRFYPCYNGR